MQHVFDISQRHFITISSKNQYISPAQHPNRMLSEHDFIYMLEGTWKIGQDGEEYLLSRDQVLILTAGKHHYGISPCSAGTKTVFIHARALPTDRAPGACICLPSHIHAGSNPAVKRCFEQVVYAKSCHDDAMAAVYFDALLYELQRCVQLASKSTVPEQIRQLIISSDRLLSNQAIADRLHISLKSAEQAFKKHFGKTIHRYQLEVKIENAKFYLSNFPDMRLHEISANLGFYDEFHFSKQFKLLTGISPGAYRKQLPRP